MSTPMSSRNAWWVLQGNVLWSNRVTTDGWHPLAPDYMSISVANGLFYKGPELVQHFTWTDTLISDSV